MIFTFKRQWYFSHFFVKSVGYRYSHTCPHPYPHTFATQIALGLIFTNYTTGADEESVKMTSHRGDSINHDFFSSRRKLETRGCGYGQKIEGKQRTDSRRRFRSEKGYVWSFLNIENVVKKQILCVKCNVTLVLRAAWEGEVLNIMCKDDRDPCCLKLCKRRMGYCRPTLQSTARVCCGWGGGVRVG